METTWCKQFAYNTNVRTIMRVRDDAVADGVNTFCANEQQNNGGSRQFSSST
jgi:ADP-dependent phosphofructokinase/glucokinase